MAAKRKARYFAPGENTESAVRNGTFTVVYPDGDSARYILGDYNGPAGPCGIPADWVEVSACRVKELAPRL